MASDQVRTYDRASSVVFLRTDAPFGGLSNMAGGFPLNVQGTRIYTSEALYQACRFPHLPEVQRLIIGQASPMTAKMKSKPHRKDSRPDWDRVRVKVMRWCLRVKLVQNWAKFSDLLLRTGDRPIVEESRRDDFWGAKSVDDRTLVGMNVLGRLLMELREAVKSQGRDAFLTVKPPDVPEFLLLGRPILGIGESDLTTGDPKAAPAAVPGSSRPIQEGVEQASLFDAPSAREALSPVYVTQKAPEGAPLCDLKPYPATKDSGVPWLGEVPEHWVVLPNRAIFDEVKERDRPDADMLSVTITKGVIRQQTLLEDSSKKDSSRLDRSAYKLVRPGDIAYNKMRAWQGAVGVSEYEGIVSPAYVVQRPRQGAAPRYVHYLLRTPAFAKEAERWSYGITSDMWSLRPEHFKMIYSCLPPLPEQAAIVHFLDHADRRIRRYIRAKQKLIKLLEEQKQAIIHRAVTRGLDPNVRLKPSGVEWLGDVPAHWEVVRLKNVASHIVDCLHATPTYTERGQFPAIRTADITPGAVHLRTARRVDDETYGRWTERLEPAAGDILYSREGERFGIAACVPPGTRLCISQRMMVFRIRPEHNSSFVMWALNSPQTYAQATQDVMGSTAPHVNVSTIRNFALALPSLDNQFQIVEHIEAATPVIRGAIEDAGREVVLLREYRTRLIADVVTGKLDVREAAARLPDEPEETEPTGEVEAEGESCETGDDDTDEVPAEAEA